LRRCLTLYQLDWPSIHHPHPHPTPHPPPQALATPEELTAAPSAFGTVPIKGGGPALQGFQYRVQVSPVDCTGCELCVNACPDNALASKPIGAVMPVESPNWCAGQRLHVCCVGQLVGGL